ncbi:MAG: P1 family peptidase [Actinomycetota bacterium]
MITEIKGIRVGHWSDHEAATGCSVILFPEDTVASGEIRGGAPATRDFSLLNPSRLVQHINAVVLSGGSAFGLSACEGVMEYLELEGIGFQTGSGRIPIVVGLSLFDLNVGDANVRPGPSQGKEAATNASSKSELGKLGAGTGATVSKWRGANFAQPGGLGGGILRDGELIVACLIAVNASGDIDDGTTSELIEEGSFVFPEILPFENTTIGVVATNAKMNKDACHLASQSAHDGYARALFPSHTSGDGDAVVFAATGEIEADLGTVRALTTLAVESAIKSVAN